ncbi:MAG TPA: transglutaminase domain-containing protein [Candidatus Lokiarchaeia archaeon]|nr:transglutaminase domain-containing protein [Candidatus Lokiarchaeia archaeon]
MRNENEGEDPAPGDCLAPTYFIDSCDPAIASKAESIVNGIDDADVAEKARQLFYFVRDNIPYKILWGLPTRKYLKASTTLARGFGFCIPKAILLAALARAVKIPARLHYADIINQLASENVQKAIGTNLFVFHGYAELFIDEAWLKVNPAFDLALTEDKGYYPVEFDGHDDAVFQATDRLGNPQFEYVHDRGTFADVPYRQIVDAWIETYGGMLETSNI